METHAFQAETQKLLDLMIHSLYSNKEVFLRELISNASDALDRRRFEAVSQSELAVEGELSIDLVADRTTRTLTVADNGIGMNREELVEHLGTIARSGTLEFLKRSDDGGEAAPDLIGESERIVVNDIMSATETSGHLIDGFGTRARAYVQVQNGCDHR